MFKELTEKEKKALEELGLPKYDKSNAETWIGSEEYYESIFATETNRDPKLHDAFSDLHKQIVNLVIKFCKEHNLTDVDEFCVGADGLQGSIPYGEWCPCTDSNMSIIKLVENKEEKSKDLWPMLPDREHPFLYEI